MSDHQQKVISHWNMGTALIIFTVGYYVSLLLNFVPSVTTILICIEHKYYQFHYNIILATDTEHCLYWYQFGCLLVWLYVI
jgi:hypothetical protein